MIKPTAHVGKLQSSLLPSDGCMNPPDEMLLSLELNGPLWLHFPTQYENQCFLRSISRQHNEQKRSWEWHLLSLRAGRPKIKLLGWAPFTAFTEISWRTNGEILTRSNAIKKPLHTYIQLYTHCMVVVYCTNTTACTKSRQSSSLYGWIRAETFCSANIKAWFLSSTGESWHNLKEKLILDQLCSLFILVMLNGSFIFNGRQDCLSLTAFGQIII